MIAAIYARKSTEQNVSDDAKSVTRQVELARAFAVNKGWRVADEHIYTDDAVSGADFVNRAGLTKLTLAAKTTPRPFDVVIAMDQDRIGRDQRFTPMILHDLRDAGIAVWYYATGEALRLDSPIDEFISNAKNFGNAWYRHQVRMKTREAMRAKAANGYVAGGKVYGYTNVREGSHVTRRVNEAEAAVVCRIFELAANGLGLLRIAKTLNDAGALSPESRRGTRDGWATTSVREILRRDLYRGRLVYGKTRWTDRGGTKVKVDVPEAEWLVREAPELRIVPDDAWKAAHARMERTRKTYSGRRGSNGQLDGRPEGGLLSRHLLSGFLRCGVCGGNMFVMPRSGKRGKPQLYYVCTTHHKRGNTRCTNRHGVPYEELTTTLLGHFRKDFLHPATLGRLFMAEFMESKRRPDVIAAQREELTTEVRQRDQELTRLTAAVTAGAGDVRAVVEAMKRAQRLRDDAAARLEHLDGLSADEESFDLAEWLAETRELFSDLQGTLEADPVAGRHVLRALLTTPLTITPVDDGRAFQYLGQGALDRLLTGEITGRPGRGVKKPNATKLVPPG